MSIPSVHFRKVFEPVYHSVWSRSWILDVCVEDATFWIEHCAAWRSKALDLPMSAVSMWLLFQADICVNTIEARHL